MTTPVNTNWALVAQHVDRFEDARRESLDSDLEDYLPDSEHPLFSEVAAELVRVDLEYSWKSGSRKPLRAYRQSVPELFADPALLASAAFEEYRQRRLVGDVASPQQYADDYGIDTSAWREIASRSLVSMSNGIDSEPATFPKPGDDFAGFRLVEEIGRGAFARVYLAEQDDLAARPVVLKITASRTLEPQHLARLQHTNIVPIYSVHEAQDLIAICMPYFGDRTLADMIHAVSLNESLPESGREFLDTVAVNGDETIAVGSESSEPKDLHLGGEHRTKVDNSKWAHLNYVDSVLSIIADTVAGLRHAHDRGVV
ncbi:MAG: hypothetical protein ACR2NU_05675, partial [Aeoliella sp.]